MLDAVLNAVVSDIQALNLQLNGSPLTVVRRKGVKGHPPSDVTTQITVDEAETGEAVERKAFSVGNVRYVVDVTIVTPGDRDWATNLDTYISWREAIYRAYLPPRVLTSGLYKTAGVWDVRPRPKTFMERAAMAKQYDLQALIIEVGVNL
jgi:hypothetical protein